MAIEVILFVYYLNRNTGFYRKTTQVVNEPTHMMDSQILYLDVSILIRPLMSVLVWDKYLFTGGIHATKQFTNKFCWE